MKVTYVPTKDDVREARKQRYLNLWPLEKQLEALTEAAMGRPEKRDEMVKDFAEIRRVLPFYENNE